MKDTEENKQKCDEEQTNDTKQNFSFINGLLIDEDFEGLNTGEVFQEF